MYQKMFYLYRHIRLDKNEPFYIGIGTILNIDKDKINPYRRAYSKTSRNLHWKNIVSNTNYNIDILFESDNISLIIKKEIEFIKLYGRKIDNGPLVNLCEGGEGIKGFNHSQETKEKLSLLHKGTKRLNRKRGYKLSLEHCNNVSNSLKGKYSGSNHWNFGKVRSDETKLKISNGNKGNKKSEEAKNKQRNTKSLNPYKHSSFTLEKISKNRKGKGLKKLRRYINNIEFTYESVNEASLKTGFRVHLIYLWLGKYQTPRDISIWEYIK